MTSRPSLLASACLTLAPTIYSQTVSEVCDLNTVPTAASSSPASDGARRGMIQCGAFWYFAATTWKEGRELWRTDGTVAGTSLVVDTYPGAVSSSPRLFCCGKDAQNRDVLFFFATTPNGTHLFRTDGTKAGTSSGTATPTPATGAPVSLNGRVYYAAQGSSGTELYSADGSEATATLVKDIWPGSSSSNPGSLTLSADGKAIYFSASDGFTSPARGQELWVTDGTSAGTVVIDIVPGTGSSSPQQFRTVNGKTLFRAYTPSEGEEVWTTDGSAAGTALFKAIYPGSNSSGPQLASGEFLGGELYFAAADATTGMEIWKTDGTPAGTVFVVDILPGTGSSFPRELLAVGNTLYITANQSELFAWSTAGLLKLRALDNVTSKNLQACGSKLFFWGNDPAAGIEPFISDGTVQGTVMLKDIAAGSGSYVTSGSFATDIGGGRCLFIASDGTSPPARGAELWTTDGSAAGTQLLLDIEPGVSTGNAINSLFLNCWGSTLFFWANDGSGTTGEEPYLWSRGGGCRLLADLAPGAASSSAPFEATSCGDRLYFVASTPASGRELVISDGTSAGTKIHDLNPGTSSSSPGNLTVWNNRLYFVANDGTSGHEVHVADPATGSVQLLKDVYPGFNTGVRPASLMAAGDTFYFVHATPNEGGELWKSDGTTAGTVLVKDINPGTASSSPQNLVYCGGRLYFTANDGNSGIELWESDGTANGTKLVRDLRAGTSTSSPSNLVCCEDAQGGARLYFTANDGSSGVEPWCYDGTTLAQLGDISPGPNSSSPGNLTCYGGKLYFRANDGSSGYEPWVSDGTTQGTLRLADINPGSGSSVSSVAFVGCGDLVYFGASDATPNSGTGSELYVTDGSPSGTRLVKDIAPGTGSSFPSRLTSASDRVYFLARTPDSGGEAWVSDGTEAGTRLVADIFETSGSSNPDQFTFVDGSMLFFATSIDHGTELWKLDCAGAITATLGQGCDDIRLDCTELLLGKTSTLRGRNVPDAQTSIGITWLSLPLVRPTTNPARYAPGCWNWIDPASFVYLATHTTSPDWVNAGLVVPNDAALRCLTVTVQSWYLDLNTIVPIRMSNGMSLTVGG